jgi:lysophospholipase L1-like esterase
MVKSLYVLLASLFLIKPAFAQESLLTDVNGDGQVKVLAFGDSITYGVGDGVSPGVFIELPPQTDGRGGYPARVETLYGVSVLNRGVPGEEIAMGGVERFASVVQAANADIVVILEGVNDSIFRLDRGQYGRYLQKMINVAKALNTTPVLATLQIPCCNHAGREPFVTSYSLEAKDLAALNDLRIMDLEKSWNTTCQNKEECELYNLPEGLHPNSLGYDVMAQTILAGLLGIDIFAVGGAAELEDALGLAPGSVVVEPEVVSQ